MYPVWSHRLSQHWRRPLHWFTWSNPMYLVSLQGFHPRLGQSPLRIFAAGSISYGVSIRGAGEGPISRWSLTAEGIVRVFSLPEGCPVSLPLAIFFRFIAPFLTLTMPFLLTTLSPARRPANPQNMPIQVLH